jgi:NAD(P)-dependent dehydrogenase (short-subunit alcohol dehydrogenase family)
MGGQLAGKVALVTGASRGIGRAIARRFAAEGASVVVSASRLGAHGELEGTLEGTVESIMEAGGRAVAEACDLSDAAARAGLVPRAESHFGPLDIIVNNAAVSKMKLPSMSSTQERSWMFDVNVNAPVDIAQQALPTMRERGSGWILNISSSTASQPTVPYRDSQMAAHIIGPYGATKAALDRYTQALAHEVAGDGVFINTLAPEAIVLTAGADYVRDIARRNPDMVEPVEVMAEAALELCSSRHVGQVCYSRQLLHGVARDVRSLDGKTAMGDAFIVADVEATA